MSQATGAEVLSRTQQFWLGALIVVTTSVILLTFYLQFQVEVGAPLVWDATDILLEGAYCPGDELEYEQGYVALTSADVRSIRTIQREFDVTGPGDLPIALVEPTPIFWSTVRGSRVEYRATVPIPVETFLGREYVAGPHYLLISVTDPNRRSQAARFRVHFEIAEGCE